MSLAAAEPDRITVGDSVAWVKSVPAYPCSSFTLTYYLQTPGGQLITIPTSDDADGVSYDVNVSPAVTALWAPGLYSYAGVITGTVNGSPFRHTLHRGVITILQNMAAAPATTHAQRCITLIEAAMEGRLPRGLESYVIDGQDVRKIPLTDLRRLRDFYIAERKLEIAKAKAEAGLPVNRSIGLRFVKPGLPPGNPSYFTTGF